MGYELHILRQQSVSGNAEPPISATEWQTAIGGDPDAESFYWNDGQISLKNPSPAQIAKMVRLAERLGAHVQGDNGELYREDGSTFEVDQPIVASSWRSLFRRISRAFQQRARRSAPFRVGQRVKNAWGEIGTVVSVDVHAHHRLGSVRVKMDDGREQDVAAVASGFDAIGE
jgi:hypothetical protein